PLPVKFRTDLPQLGDVIFHAEFASHCGEIWATPRVMCQVRIHSDSASTKNLKNVNAWVRDEWKAMLLVHSMMRERAFTGLFSEQKLQLLFAARSRVKMKMVKPLSSEYAEEIARLAKDQIGEAKWLAAIVIVAL